MKPIALERSPHALELLAHCHRLLAAQVRRAFVADHSNAEAHPLLALFLREEARLGLVRRAVDVLAWHRVLFQAYAPSQLTREDATRRERIARATAVAAVRGLQPIVVRHAGLPRVGEKAGEFGSAVVNKVKEI